MWAYRRLAHGAGLGIDVEVVRRNPGDSGFVVQPKRYVVEQTNGTLMLDRRLVRDYESGPASAESRVLWAGTANMTRRLTGAATATWRAAEERGQRGHARQAEITGLRETHSAALY